VGKKNSAFIRFSISISIICSDFQKKTEAREARPLVRSRRQQQGKPQQMPSAQQAATTPDVVAANAVPEVRIAANAIIFANVFMSVLRMTCLMDEKVLPHAVSLLPSFLVRSLRPCSYG
jgi:hypothetical protein